MAAKVGNNRAQHERHGLRGSPRVPRRPAPPGRPGGDRGAGGRAARGGRDPSPGDRRRRARPPVHERPRGRLPPGDEPLRHTRNAPSWPSAAAPQLFVRRVAELAQTLLPPSPRKLWDARDVLARGGRASGPAAAARARSRRWWTTDVRLDRLPVLTCWPEDGGPFLTLPTVYTEHPSRPGPQPRHLPHAGARRRGRPACTGRSARVAASTTRRRKRRARRCP